MTTALKLPSIIASRYLPVRLIAKGGMGAVYEVEHARTGEHLALKVLLSSVGSSVGELDRFKREARASARIKSEHVVHVIDADVAPELDGAPFLVMELLEGADLERVVTSAPAPPAPALVVDWLRQVARALDKAHRLGIVHRDLKPENLFLATAEDRPPIVKVLDFGIVKMIEEGSGATSSGEILGTPKYMAPEQASTQGKVTAATDLYALGMVAYRLLAGETYYRGDVLSILAQLLHEPLQPPSRRNPSFGGAFDIWFLRACHRDVELRFASAGQQIEALAEVFALPTLAVAGARAPGRFLPKSMQPRRKPPIAVLVVTGLVAASLLAGIFLDRERRATGSPASAAVASARGAVLVVPPGASPVAAPAVVPVAAPSSTSYSPRIPLSPTIPAAVPARRRISGPEPRAQHAVRSVADHVKPTVVDPYADQK